MTQKHTPTPDADGMYDYALIGVGAEGKMFTFRTSMRHYSGGEVLNGKYTGIKTMREQHIQNLGQDADEAYEKALLLAWDLKLPLETTREDLANQLTEIARKTKAEIAEKRAYESTHFTFGKYKDKTVEEVAALDMGYINWVAQNFHGKPIHQAALAKSSAKA